jgi:two-component system response regulator YesN
VGFNPTYFSVVFKKETGMNFLEYLTDVRIREAKRLLSDPRKTIADVALEVGYNDVKHFSRVFTRSTGLHPSKYRKLYY